MTDLALYGVSRTVCACQDCITKCRHMSGMIIPRDLARWRVQMGAHAEDWLLAHVAASPGALVAQKGQVLRIPTLVPYRLKDGRCYWLSKEERCLIHSTAPYGCAVFDCTQSVEKGNRRSEIALIAILYDWETDGPYSQLWRTLDEKGQTVEAPEMARMRIRQETS